MGNKLGRRRQVVDEKYTRPQGLYHHKDVDIKKLRKLILESKLAPCYPGVEDGACDLDECPICFLYYPSLNRSRCCTKGICTECFLQMKVPNSNRPTQCPFCKTLNYAVEYRGVKTKEEKGIEQVEEQRVIEAKIRMRQKELQDEEERMQKRQDLSSSSSRNLASREIENSSAGAPSRRSHVECEDVVSDGSCAPSVPTHPPLPRTNREDEFDLDLEDIMVMEAIWLSIQERGKQKALGYGGEVGPSEHYVLEDHYVSEPNPPIVAACSAASPSGGLACAIAALAERQQMTGESSSSSSIHNPNNNVPNYNNMLPSCGAHYHPTPSDHYHPNSSLGPSHNGSMINSDEWSMECGGGSGIAEAGTASYQGSDSPPQHEHEHDEVEESNVPAPIIPESFEEQMMLAMAVSLAEARAPGVLWQ